jgi:hypothetical protein
MMTAVSIPSPAVEFPRFRTTNGRLDYRTRDGVPFLHQGSYYDSFEQAMQFERWIFGRSPGLPTPEELDAEREAKRLKQIERAQPGDADAGGVR